MNPEQVLALLLEIADLRMGRDRALAEVTRLKAELDARE